MRTTILFILSIFITTTTTVLSFQPHFTSMRTTRHMTRLAVTDSSTKISSTHPILEYTRYRLYKRLRNRFQELLISQGVVSKRGWIRCFERWQFHSKLHGLNGQDSLIPCFSSLNKGDEYAKKNLIRDITQLESSNENIAQIVTNQIYLDAENTIKVIHNSKQYLSPCVHERIYTLSELLPKQITTNSGIYLIKNTYTIDLQLNNTYKVFRLNHVFYSKLLSQWENTLSHDNRNDRSSSMTDTDGNVIQIGSFYSDLYALLARYEALEGFGWQAAIPPSAFTQISRIFNVTCEGFASPFNSHIQSYCSLFSDTDSVFGSIGNFFQFSPKMGSFQCNPPFVQQVIEKMLDHICQLIRHSNGPMSFIVIVPAWIDDPFYTSLIECEYTLSNIIIDAKEHFYCDGAQYNRRETYRGAAFDTAVFIIQNYEGALTWPCDERAKGEIRAAFRPNESLATDLQELRTALPYTPKWKRGV